MCDRHKKLPDQESVIQLLDIPLVPEDEDRSTRILDVNGEEILSDAEITVKDIEADNDFYSAMERSYDSRTRSVRDLRIDDDQFDLAKNCLDWSSPKFLSKGVKTPFARQLWLMVHLASEWCPRCTDPSVVHIQDVPVDMDPFEYADRAKLLHHGKCPKCGIGKSELILKKEIPDIHQLIAALGQRSGKSSVATLLASYWTHRILCMPRYGSLCSGIQDFSPITVTFVALSRARAIKLLWRPYQEILLASDWFKEYHAMLKNVGKRYGEEFFKSNVESLTYGHKNLEIFPVGPMKRVLRGDTRVMSIIDELGWFKYSDTIEDNPDELDAAELANADEVHTSLENSMLTVRTEVWRLYEKHIDHVPTAVGVYISSPSSWKDKICRLLKESDSSTTMLGVRLSTWEVNPFYSRDHPFIVDQYKKSVVKADRDFGANPPQLNAAMYDREEILALCQGVNHWKTTSHLDNKRLRISASVSPTTGRTDWPPTILTIDAGYSNNSFSFCLSCLDRTDNRMPIIMTPEGQPASSNLLGLRVLAMGEIIPDSMRRIDFADMYDKVIKVLIQGSNVRYLAADRWNSLSILHQAESDFPDLTSVQITLRHKDFKDFDESWVRTGQLILPALEMEPKIIEEVSNYRKDFVGTPISHLYLQFLTVQDTGETVTKGDGYTDDLYRTLILAGSAFQKPKILKAMLKARNRNTGIRNTRSVVLKARKHNPNPLGML